MPSSRRTRNSTSRPFAHPKPAGQETFWIRWQHWKQSLSGASLTTTLPPHPTFLDLGTGGGFPLLPLAVCLPQCTCVGMDSVQKKVAAVQRIIDALKIPNASLVCGRSEELARQSVHREQYDIVLCRGFAALNVLLELAAPFVKVGGHILCWKSLKIEQELQDSLLARSELSCQMEKPYEYDLGGTWGRRQILIFRKRAKTSAKYPREVGEPKKNPLL
ncbi:MAG: 16S rRNA (guanine(527)-N(7))-methyltransferase RsmG [Candidatus Peribacter sp.]|nr:16S rRNA (guanine(527)-N(7))-methyltransferase RsmG [Candidatus Peribacter sp.]